MFTIAQKEMLAKIPVAQLEAEIELAIRITHPLFPQVPVRFVADSGLDDQKFYRLVIAPASAVYLPCPAQPLHRGLQRALGPLGTERLLSLIPTLSSLSLMGNHQPGGK